MTGEDAPAFLQGQFTNDLSKLAPLHASYGLWLNVKGKVLADSFVVRGAAPGEFWIGSYFSAVQVIRERLESFIIADDVTVEDTTAQWSAVTLLGREAETLRPGAGEGICFPGRRGGAAWEWVFPAGQEAAVRARLAGCAEVGAAEMERRRIEAAIPAVPADVGPADLPNEAGLEEAAISYTKGCYLGQEVMARLKSMGRVRRRLLRVRTSDAGGLAALPAPLFAGERQVGEVRSDATDEHGGRIGLAMLSLLHLPADGMLAAAPGVPASWRVIDQP